MEGSYNNICFMKFTCVQYLFSRRCVLPLLLVLFFLTSAYGGLAIKMKDAGGNEEDVQLYGGSYALLIGASTYTAGWPSLESIPGELDDVEKLLTGKGFVVNRVHDPNSKQLKDAFTSFINQYGYDQNNRLLFFYSGHGYTRMNGRKGYLVPVDAPDPDKDEKPYFQSYDVPVDRQVTVHELLNIIHRDFDGTLAFRDFKCF